LIAQKFGIVAIRRYVLEKGEIYGVSDSRGQQEYRKALPMVGELQVTDIRGKTFAFTYSTVNSCYWAPYPSNTYLQTSMRVNYGGKVGYRVQQIALSRAYLTRHREAIGARY
jgi:hypothetical protein